MAVTILLKKEVDRNISTLSFHINILAVKLRIH